MKKSPLLTGLALAGALTLSACSPQPPPAEAPPAPKPVETPAASVSKSGFTSAEKTSFAEVTSHLDTGGNFYLYLGAEQWLNDLSSTAEGWRPLFMAAPDLDEDTKASVNLGFNVVTRLIRNSGIEEISGVGVSGIAREKGLNRTKVLIHHYPGKDQGFVWSLLGTRPHTLEGLNLLPATTAFASFNDFDITLAWQVIEKELNAAGVPKAKEAVAEFKAMTEKELGLSLDKLLASLGGELGFILTLDETKKMPLPFPGASGEPMQIAEPGFMFVVRVKDQTIFNLVDSKLPPNDQMIKVDEADLKMRTMPLPLPFPLRPTIAQSGGYFFFASTDKLLKEALAVKKGEKPGLKAAPEFIRLARDIPLEGNGFTYMSPRFGQTWMDLQMAAMDLGSRSRPSAATDAFTMELMKKFMGPSSANMTFNVFANTDHGWLSTGNTTQEPAKIVLATGFVFTVPVLAAIAIPNFVKARGTAQKNACIANLKMLDGATQQWALENAKTDNDKVNVSAITQYLRNNTLPACPQGGTYTFGKVEDSPKCSIPGHEIHF